MWLFSCDLRGISIGDLPTSLPIKRWISLPNHATYAHNSGIRRHIYGKSALSIPYSPLMDCHFTLMQMENRRWAVYALCSSFVVSIDGLLLLHFCKWRTGGEPYRPRVLPSLSPLTDCYFYTSANGERAVSRTCLVFFPHCLHWWIVTSTLLQTESLPTFPFYTSHDKNWLSMTISDRRFRPVLFFLYFVFRNNTGCVI